MRNLSRGRVSNNGTFLWYMAVITFSLLTVASLFAGQGHADKPSKEAALQEIQRLQSPFIANNGQVDERVRFYAKTFGGTVFVTKDGVVVYSLPESRQEDAVMVENGGKQAIEISDDTLFSRGKGLSPLAAGMPYPAPQGHQICRMRGIVLKEQLIGGKIGEITGRGQSPSTVNYFHGNDTTRWKSNISAYTIVDMGEVYTGIGLRLKAYGNNVEKLFTVKPGANHEAIRVRLEGAKGLKVNEAGELVAETELGPVKFTRPVAYQMIEGIRVEAECNYTISDYGIRNVKRKTSPKSANRNPKSKTPSPVYGFKVARYDKTQDLIIDPLLASTFLGGAYEDYGKSVAVDTRGNVYVAGETLSPDFPKTSGVYDMSHNGSTDVFVSKFNSELTNLLASTFLGGALNHDRCHSIAVDSGGNIIVAGATYSTDFPTTRGAYDPAGNGSWDVFVSKFNSGLTKLLASTFLGKKSDEFGYSIALDAGGNIYVAGATYSTNFPTTPDAYDTSYNGGYSDVFVSKFNNTLTTLLASTFLGGGSGDYGMSVAIDGLGNVLVTGNAASKDFPATTGAYKTVHHGGSEDVFISKFSSGLTGLLASTFLGGYSSDSGKSIAVDDSGNVYVTGETISSNFPTTAEAFDTSYHRGSKDAYVSKFDSGLTGLSASTLLGGHLHDSGKSMAIDSEGNIFVTGATQSTDFPTTSGAYDTSANGSSDVFISKFNGMLTSLLTSTYYGGSRSDVGNSIAVDREGNVYVTGETQSSDLPPISGAYNTSYYRCEDVFVSGFDSKLSADKANKERNIQTGVP